MLYLHPFPRSGMMLNGILYPLDLLEPFMKDGDCLSLPTPCSRDYKGGRCLENPKAQERGDRNNLSDWFRWNGNWLYPPVRAVEYMMGFPEGWTDLDA